MLPEEVTSLGGEAIGEEVTSAEVSKVILAVSGKLYIALIEHASVYWCCICIFYCAENGNLLFLDMSTEVAGTLTFSISMSLHYNSEKMLLWHVHYARIHMITIYCMFECHGCTIIDSHRCINIIILIAC